jgi:hypothetical protein
VRAEKAIEMMKLTKRQIEVTIFAGGVGRFEGWQVGEWFIANGNNTIFAGE